MIYPADWYADPRDPSRDRWWDGSQWSWANQGKPDGGYIASVGVVTVMDTPMSPQRPYAFLQGTDGNLWVNWWG